MKNLLKLGILTSFTLFAIFSYGVSQVFAASCSTTTLGSASDPSSVTKAPGAAIVDGGGFTFICSGTTGSDSITSLTISLAGSGTPYNGLAEVRITDTTGATTYYSASSTIVSNTMTFTGGTPIPVSKNSATFKIRITPKTHANMPAPNGALYALSPVVTGWVGTLTHAGTDSNAGTTTIDNLSPTAATSVSISGGTGKMTLGWTSTNGETTDSIILRWAASSAGSEVPAEGTDYATSTTISTATVACVFSGLTSATVKSSVVDGLGATNGCTTTGLTAGQAYTYKVFQQDANGNYDTGTLIGTATTSIVTSTVTTQSASSVTATGATLNGNITATGGANATIRGFAWGTNSSLVGGDTATTTELGSFSTGAFTNSALTLVGNTTYYSRAYAVNSAGTSSGSISNAFLTLPNTPGTPTGSAITATTLTINWTAPTGGAVTYKIERCTGVGCSSYSELTTGIAGLSYDDSGLTAGTVYRYRVRATNATGDGAYATSVDITTSATATTELSAYRFFATSTSYTPGTAFTVQNTAATLVSTGDSFRMRLLIHFGTSDVAISERSFKLQFAAKSGTCDTSFTGETYADVSTDTAISFKDSASISDNNPLGAAADLTHGGDTIVNQTYEEANTFTNSQSGISAGQDAKWDFSLYDNGASAGQAYCLRVVNADGSTLSSYSQIPEIIMVNTGAPALEQIHYKWRNDNGSESTATFSGTEDTTLSSGVFLGDRKRLRISLSNTGTAAATNYNYKIEYSSTACTVWTAVPSYGSYTTEHFTMDQSGNSSDGAVTTNSSDLTDPAGPTFLAGLLQTTQNQTANFTLANNQFTELEYALRSTENVSVGTTYCFRLTNSGSTANFTYTVLPRIVITAASQRPVGGGGGNAGGESNGTPGASQGGGSNGGGGGNAGGESGGTPGGSTGGGGAGGGGNSE